jgi:glycosyltransferase involved in cell wall biosynthesis
LRAALYARATAVLVPSHSEGFGLPAVEALGQGVPVVASSGGSLREVLGSAPEGSVRFADPDAPQEWVAAIGSLLDADELVGATEAARRYVPPQWPQAARGFALALTSTFGQTRAVAAAEESR